MTRTIPTSLPNCARRHPDEPSDIGVENGRYGGKPFTRLYCRVCKSVASKRLHSELRAQAAQAGYRSSIARQPYGALILPALCWTPPERLLVEAAS